MELFFIIFFLFAVGVVAIIIVTSNSSSTSPANIEIQGLIYQQLEIPNDQNIFLLNPEQKLLVFSEGKLIKKMESSFNVKTFLQEVSIKKTNAKISDYQCIVFNEGPFVQIPLKVMDKIVLKDKLYHVFLKLSSVATIAFQVTDIQKLLEYMSFYQNSYSIASFVEDLQTKFSGFFQSWIHQYALEQKISLTTLNYFMLDLEKLLLPQLKKHLLAFGVDLIQFELANFTFESDEEFQKLNNLLIENLKYEILGYTYKEERLKQFLKSVGYSVPVTLNETQVEDQLPSIKDFFK
jgi:membrane protease subunit (stomatin/prohibitin family)